MQITRNVVVEIEGGELLNSRRKASINIRDEQFQAEEISKDHRSTLKPDRYFPQDSDKLPLAWRTNGHMLDMSLRPVDMSLRPVDMSLRPVGIVTKPSAMIGRPSMSDEYSVDGRRGLYSPERTRTDLISKEMTRSQADSLVHAEKVKARVFTEYFSMIDDWVIVADMKLNIISNNYSAKIVDNVISKFNKQKKRINVQNLNGLSPGVTLDGCFKFVDREQIRCTEETIMNLVDIYTMLDFKNKKLNNEDMQRFQDKKIVGILKSIENISKGIKISNKQEENSQSSKFKKVNKMKSSMRAINIKNSNLTVS